MLTITLSDSFDVSVDGTLYGALADTVANNPKLASDIQRAIPVKLAELAQRSADALKAANELNADLLKQAEQAGSDVAAEYAAYKARAEQLIAAAQANVDDHDALKAVVAEAVKPEKDRQREALLSARAELDAQLAAL